MRVGAPDSVPGSSYFKHSKHKIQEFPLHYVLKYYLHTGYSILSIGKGWYYFKKPCQRFFWKPSKRKHHYRLHFFTSCVRFCLLTVGGARRTSKPPPALKSGTSLGSKLPTGSLCVSHKSPLNGSHKWLKWLFCKRQDLKSRSLAFPLRTLVFVDWRSSFRNTEVIT